MNWIIRDPFTWRTFMGGIFRQRFAEKVQAVAVPASHHSIPRMQLPLNAFRVPELAHLVSQMLSDD